MPASPKPYLDALFDHDPAVGEAWYWQDPAAKFQEALDELNRNEGLVVDVLRAAFGDFVTHMADYSPWQVATGVYFIFNNSLSNFAFALKSPARPLQHRVAVVAGLRQVFDRVFERHCEEGLGHLDQADNTLNKVCYMFWDVTPIMRLGVPEISAECLGVMRHCLKSRNAALIESALHGLGHSASAFPEAMEAIDEYMRGSFTKTPELLAYAGRARLGLIA
jgi:hypothetical protein